MQRDRRRQKRIRRIKKDRKGSKMGKDTKTNAIRILEKENIPFTIILYECEEFINGITVADQLKLPYQEVYKTLVAKGKKEYFVFVIPIAQELDLKKAAKAVGEKSVELIPVKEIQKVTGYIRGGCTAIGMKKQFQTVIDRSAQVLSQIYVSGGKWGVQLCLKPEDYKKVCKGEYSDIIMEKE